MPKAKSKNILGAWAFLIGVILAIVLGLFSNQFVGQAWIIYLLIILGIIIGLLNVSGRETMQFLLVGTALVVVAKLGGGDLLNVPYIGPVISAIVILFVPAVMIVALKAAFSLASK